MLSLFMNAKEGVVCLLVVPMYNCNKEEEETKIFSRMVNQSQKTKYRNSSKNTITTIS